MTASPLSTSVALSIAVAVLGAFSAADPTPGAHPSTPTPRPARHAAAAVPDPIRDHAALGLPSSQGLTVRSSLVDETTGTTVVRYDRTYQGMRVIGGDVLVDLAATGAVKGVEWNAAKDLAPATPTARVGTTQALRAGAQRSLAVTGTETGSATPVVYAADGSPRLAYDVLTTGIKPDQTPTRLHTIVDASTGQVITSYDEIETGIGNSMYSGTVSLDTTKSGSVYQLKDSRGNFTTDLAGATTGAGLLFTDPDDTWGNGSASNPQTAAVDAQYGAEKTYEYYSTVLGRAGIWDNGQGAPSRVHYGSDYVNAFWDGSQMTYGDGANNLHPLTALDIAAHEMSHGVMENTANLQYSGESGGLNEANSDIFGTAVEFFANNPNDVGDYLIGEEADVFGNGTPLRYMDKPSRDGRSPDCWSPTLKDLDVHYSSGPLNHWFYLASEGSGAKTINGVQYNSPTCNGSTVTGTGRDAVEKIWYRTITTKLTSSSDYAAAREGAIASAKELYGVNSAQCRSVESAFDAIAVAQGNQTCWGTLPTTNLLANPGFEQGAASWTTNSSFIVTNTLGPAAHTGTWRARLGGTGRVSYTSIGQQVTLPPGTYPSLTFWVRVDTTEPSVTQAYDLLVPQVVAGSSVTTLGTLSNLTKTSGGYIRQTYDLSAFAGRTVTLRFVAREDSRYATSFTIDDVAVTG